MSFRSSTALCVAGLALATALSGCGRADPADARIAAIPDTVTFAGHVAPIVWENCSTCHRPDGPAPFPLLSWKDVRARGPRIAEVVEKGIMPPWQPVRGEEHFANARGLTEEQIAILGRWVELGMPAGDLAEAPPPPTFPGGWRLGEPDLVVEMPEGYPLPAGGGEEFRNIVFDVPIESDRWVEAIEIRPEDPRVVHHATLTVDRTDSSRRRDAEDPGPGFAGMGGATAARNPGGFFIGWAPGKIPTRPPEGVSWRLEKGADLVLMLHLRPIEEPTDAKASIGLHFAEKPPERVPAVIRLGSEAFAIPAGASDFAVTDTFRVPVDVEALGIFPHAHYLADEMEAWAILPGGERKDLIHIPDWDFNWQDQYRFAEPIELPAGTVLSMRYTYDNSADNPQNPNDPPERVAYGSRSVDEMADLMLQVLPEERDDLETLRRRIQRKNLAIQMEGFRFRLENDPDDVPARYNLAWALSSLGRWGEAIPHYRRVVRLAPDHARAHNNLAIALQATGDVAGAARHYRQALEIQPDDPKVRFNLGVALGRLGDLDGAIEELREAVRLDPDLARARLHLADALRASGRMEAAAGQYRQALEADPDDARGWFRLGYTLGATGRIGEALEALEEAARVEPRWPAPLVAMAEILATHPDPRVRDPERAVELARQAVRLTQRADPSALSALAAAQAAAGDYDLAAEIAGKALSIASASGETELAERIRRSLDRYRRGLGP
ncbi:MAG: tetratricopeptide repeat protein [Gemmatimonadota bacterium]|nr:tetratricopeptide repeat protein [Gemmatimonadota bacterium]